MSVDRRFHARDLPERGGELALDPSAARHVRVLRLEVGDPIVLFDGRGREADATITRIDESGVVCAAGASRAKSSAAKLVLCQCIPKGAKLDDIVRATTEIGVSAIHLVESERSVPRGSEKRLDRLERIAREAARQSGRADVPDLVSPAPLDDVLARAPASAVRLAFVPGGAPLDEACPSVATEAWIVVGPEGGLASGEIERARAAGFLPVGLGATVLRVETAAPVALALVAHRLGVLRSAPIP